MQLILNTFFGDTQSTAQGNLCRVIVGSPEVIKAPVIVKKARSVGARLGARNIGARSIGERSKDTRVTDLTHCYTWPVFEYGLSNASEQSGFENKSGFENSSYYVRCEQEAGSAIACCGHGLLSAAFYWMRERQQTQVFLHMGNSRIHASIEGDLIWLQFPRIVTQACARPTWLERFFPDVNGLPVRCSVAGGESAYLIIQWPDDSDLTELDYPVLCNDQLANYTSRALICTAKQTGQGEDIHYRYFAPQYSSAEDQATGSAMRVLVAYFQQQELRSLQVSSAKGLLFGRFDSGSVFVGGSCREASIDQYRV